VDGGVDLKNAVQLVNAGADILVAGQAIFGATNPIETIHLLKNI
ncbi:MAG: ribulose-phosphate 3-epimerase, partial [Bacteroidales bacterium]